MGKAQSKRSVDITTDPKKDGIIEEGTGELKKIEDVDQLKPQVNGDTHHNDNDEKDKIATVETTGETENEKDLSTEKEQGAQIDAKAQVEGAGDATIITPTVVTSSEDGGDEVLDESKGGSSAAADTSTSTTAETPDSSKKPKKEKVKKKWSFRSISFGKKDKQKPAKKDDANTSAVNGECEKVPEETTEEPIAENKDETAAGTTDTAAVELSTETPLAAATEVVASTITATVAATPESPKEETVTTAATDVTVDKPITEIKVDGDITMPITNGNTSPTITPTAETKVEEITESLAAVKINNEKIDENVETVPEIKKTEEKQQQQDEVNISLTQSSPVAVAATTVVEDIITTNGDNHNNVDDIKINGDNNDVKTVEATINNESSSKLNGSSESPKIEVKEDIITATTTTTTLNNILLNQDNQKNNQIIEPPPVIDNNNSSNNNNIVAQNNDNNNKNIQLPLSTPPLPPLPCSLPPSQVMVFALSDIQNETTTSNNDQKQQTAEEIIEVIQQQQQQQEDNKKIDESINTVYEKLATTIEEFIPIPEGIIPEEIHHKIVNITEIECKLPIVKQEIEEKLPEKDVENDIQSKLLDDENLIKKNLEKISNNNIEEIDIEQHSLQIADKELTKNELIIPETIDIITTTPISQNINLPDETKIIQEIEIEQHTSQLPDIELSKNEVIIQEINEIPLPPSSPIQTITNNQKEFDNDEDLPTPPPSPIQDDIMINNEFINDATTVTDSTIIETQQKIDLVGIESTLDLDKMTGSSAVLLITAEQGIQVNDGDVSDPQEEQEQQQQNKQKQQQPQKRNKENGVGENHAETSATESLNGGVEHKTIEEIKAENQQIEKNATAEVTQEAATVVAE